MNMSFDINKPSDPARDDLDAIVSDIDHVRDGINAIEMMADSFSDVRHRNALATMAHALSSTLDAIGERVTKIDHRERGDLPLLKALIAKRDRIYRATIAPGTSDAGSEAENEKLIAVYDAANDAWLSASVTTLAEVREKAAYALARPDVIEHLRENDDELQLLLASIVGAAK